MGALFKLFLTENKVFDLRRFSPHYDSSWGLRKKNQHGICRFEFRQQSLPSLISFTCVASFAQATSFFTYVYLLPFLHEFLLS